MQLTDRVTPSLQEYQNQLQNYSQSGSETTRQRANDWATMYYQNAYNMQMQNFMNEYNSPLQQMLRYQEAGINPNLAASDSGNMASAPAAAAPKGSADRGPTRTDIANLSLQGITSVQQSLRTAQTIYDYINYGEQYSKLRNYGLEQENAAKQAEADWQMYWNYGEDFGPNSVYVQGSPHAVYMANSTQRIAAQIGQLEYLTKQLYPEQKQALAAQTALRQLQKEVEEGKKGAILQLDTGNATADSIIKMICFWLLNK